MAAEKQQAYHQKYAAGMFWARWARKRASARRGYSRNLWNLLDWMALYEAT